MRGQITTNMWLWIGVAITVLIFLLLSGVTLIQQNALKPVITPGIIIFRRFLK